ncbi:unnamed protein product [Protopolystoma xenopodis]|uniref:Uncharacterized protein n=1 Tax=Protopolystoma xenopodis TaxID=117903 RepID=A0A448XN17_9PLAT|nr:unnamed protein product [Protopolystoma xenopodis]
MQPTGSTGLLRGSEATSSATASVSSSSTCRTAALARGAVKLPVGEGFANMNFDAEDINTLLLSDSQLGPGARIVAMDQWSSSGTESVIGVSLQPTRRRSQQSGDLDTTEVTGQRQEHFAEQVKGRFHVFLPCVTCHP